MSRLKLAGVDPWPGNRPGVAPSFEELLAASTLGSPECSEPVPARAYARLDEAFDRRNNQKGDEKNDIDDVLVHLVDRAFEPIKSRADVVHRPRPTWIYPHSDVEWVVDYAGAQVIRLHYLTARDSRHVVWFVEYSEPATAQAVVRDLLEKDVFSTIGRQAAKHLVWLAFERRASSIMLEACSLAIPVSGVVDDTIKTLEEKTRERRTSGHDHKHDPNDAASRGPATSNVTTSEIRRDAPAMQGVGKKIRSAQRSHLHCSSPARTIAIPMPLGCGVHMKEALRIDTDGLIKALESACSRVALVVTALVATATTIVIVAVR